MESLKIEGSRPPNLAIYDLFSSICSYAWLQKSVRPIRSSIVAIVISDQNLWYQEGQENPFIGMIYNSLQAGIFTTMIGFVTWPPFYLISKILVAYNASGWPRTFLQPGCFCTAFCKYT